MKENQKDLLGRILIILEQCREPLDEKAFTSARSLIAYISYAHSNKLSLVPETYREFAQQMKHYYPVFKKLKTNQEKIEKLTKIVQECHASLEAA